MAVDRLPARASIALQGILRPPFTVDDAEREIARALIDAGWRPPADPPHGCARCGATKWVDWQDGPSDSGRPRRARCLSCGHYQYHPEETDHA